MSCDKCSLIFQNEKFTHTFHAYNNNNLDTFIRFLQPFTCWLSLLHGYAPQTPIIIERFRFISLFIFSSILRENFMASKKASRWINETAKHTHCNFHFPFLYLNYSIQLRCMSEKKSSQIAFYRVSIYQFWSSQWWNFNNTPLWKYKLKWPCGLIQKERERERVGVKSPIRSVFGLYDFRPVRLFICLLILRSTIYEIVTEARTHFHFYSLLMLTQFSGS